MINLIVLCMYLMVPIIVTADFCGTCASFHCHGNGACLLWNNQTFQVECIVNPNQFLSITECQEHQDLGVWCGECSPVSTEEPGPLENGPIVSGAGTTSVNGQYVKYPGSHAGNPMYYLPYNNDVPDDGYWIVLAAGGSIAFTDTSEKSSITVELQIEHRFPGGSTCIYRINLWDGVQNRTVTEALNDSANWSVCEGGSSPLPALTYETSPFRSDPIIVSGSGTRDVIRPVNGKYEKYSGAQPESHSGHSFKLMYYLPDNGVVPSNGFWIVRSCTNSHAVAGTLSGGVQDIDFHLMYSCTWQIQHRFPRTIDGITHSATDVNGGSACIYEMHTLGEGDSDTVNELPTDGVSWSRCGLDFGPPPEVKYETAETSAGPMITYHVYMPGQEGFPDVCHEVKSDASCSILHRSLQVNNTWTLGSCPINSNCPTIINDHLKSANAINSVFDSLCDWVQQNHYCSSDTFITAAPTVPSISPTTVIPSAAPTITAETSTEPGTVTTTTPPRRTGDCMVSHCQRCETTGAEVFGGDLSLEECKQKCLDHQDCKGINFGRRDRKCYLKLEQSQNYVETRSFDAWSLKRNCKDSDLIRLTESFRGADKFFRIQRTNDGHGFLQMKMGLMEEWYTVNAKGFGSSELSVACHQLGFSRNAAHTKKAVYLAPGLFKQDKFINNVHCDGSEQRLQDCVYDSEGKIGGAEAIEVTCTAETVDVVVEVQGVTESNKDIVCDGFAEAVNGSTEYCSLSGPNTKRRRLTTNLYMDITVRDATVAVATMKKENFVETIVLPSEVKVTTVTAKKSTPVVKVCPPNTIKKSGDCYCKHDRTLLASETNCPTSIPTTSATTQQSVDVCFISVLFLLGLLI